MQTGGGRAGGAVLALAAIIALGAWLLRSPTGPGDARSSRGARESPLPADSRRLLKGELDGVSLGMDMTSLLQAHPRLKRQVTADRDGLLVFEEALASGPRVLFFLADVEPLKLARVQIASQLPTVEDVVKRVLDRQQRLGAPDVWDCPARDGQLPTRRYTYRANSAAAADVYVLVGERPLATYYVASANDIRDSLQLAGCISTPPERASRFPVVPTAAPAAP